MRRVVWVAVGAVVGVVAVRTISRKLGRLSPESLPPLAGQALESWHEFGRTVREAMSERETDLRQALGITGAPAAGEYTWDPAPRGRAGRAEPEPDLPYEF